MKTATAYAPGRVELLGNHTDYNQGLVLAACIDRGLTVHGQSRDDDRVILHSQTLGCRFETTLADVAFDSQQTWVNYPLGVIHELLTAGYTLRGCDVEISGDLPVGGGLSSSAALEVATAIFLARLHDLRIPALALAKLCHRAETLFVGVPSGLLDQVTCVFGRADHAVFLDCRSEEIQTVPLPAGLAFVIADSGTKHQLISSDYATRRAECAAAAEQFGVQALRDLTSEKVRAFGREIDPVLRRRALHITGENERVRDASHALASADASRFGALMNASHESSRILFENSTPELDLLTETARALPGVLGARLTGGGFGGSAVMLVRAELADSIAEQLARDYRRKTGIEPLPFITKASDGAR